MILIGFLQVGNLEPSEAFFVNFNDKRRKSIVAVA